MGRIFISVLLGLGLATLFRKVCTDKNCIAFNGPVISEVQGKTYKHGEMCYQYTSSATTCDPKKKIVDMSIGSTPNGDLPNVGGVGSVPLTGPSPGSLSGPSSGSTPFSAFFA